MYCHDNATNPRAGLTKQLSTLWRHTKHPQCPPNKLKQTPREAVLYCAKRTQKHCVFGLLSMVFRLCGSVLNVSQKCRVDVFVVWLVVDNSVCDKPSSGAISTPASVVCAYKLWPSKYVTHEGVYVIWEESTHCVQGESVAQLVKLLRRNS